jgi:hypothetical protein
VVISLSGACLSLFGQNLHLALTNKRVSMGNLPLPEIYGVPDVEPDLILVQHHAWNGHMTAQAGRVHISPVRISFYKRGEQCFHV